jgi:hypothetical protein
MVPAYSDSAELERSFFSARLAWLFTVPTEQPSSAAAWDSLRSS